MLDLEVQPERSLGNEQWEFVLGMPLLQAIQVIKSQDTAIKSVYLCYNEQNPQTTDLILNLTQDGIRLIFDANCQTLKIIEICNMTRVKLKYCGMYFNNSPVVPPTIAQIDQSFGATHPGVYISEKQLLVLNFRGLSFEFRIDPKLEPSYLHGIGSLRFPAGVSPVVNRMFVYTGHTREAATSPPLPINCFHGACYLEKLDVLREHGRQTTGLRFHIFYEGNNSVRLSQSRRMSQTKTIRFGDSCQDVLSALGCPSKVFYKAEDKMKIHSSVAVKTSRAQRTDYFFNYYTLGVDILFDATSHRAKKFVLHTNFPGHYNFNIYYRCFFHIPIAPLKHGPSDDVDRSSLMPTTSDQQLEIHFDTKWHTIRDVVLAPGTKPVVLNRASATNTTNPFGSTFCYGVQDMIFEVMPNQHIASVTLYHRPMCRTTSHLDTTA